MFCKLLESQFRASGTLKFYHPLKGAYQIHLINSKCNIELVIPAYIT